MKNTLLGAAAVAALAIAAAPAVQAADAPKPAAKPVTPAAKPAATAPATPSPAEIANMQRAARIMQVFIAVLDNKDTKPEVRNALLVCLYNNKLAAISAATGQAMAKDPALKENDLNDVLHTAGGLCGLKFGTVAAAAPAPAPARPAAPAAGATNR